MRILNLGAHAPRGSANAPSRSRTFNQLIRKPGIQEDESRKKRECCSHGALSPCFRKRLDRARRLKL